MVVVSAPTGARAQVDLSGAWSFTATSERLGFALYSAELDIRQDGQVLSVTGQHPRATRPIEMRGVVDGSEVRLEWDWIVGGGGTTLGTVEVVFTSFYVAEGRMSGSMELGDLGTGVWSAFQR